MKISKQDKKDAIEFLKNTIQNMKGHGYKKKKNETEEYTHKREHHDKVLRRWKFLLKAARSYKDENK